MTSAFSQIRAQVKTHFAAVRLRVNPKIVGPRYEPGTYTHLPIGFFHRARGLALRDGRLPRLLPQDAAVLSALCDLARNRQGCLVTQADLGQTIGRTQPTVSRAISRLRAWGFIEVVPFTSRSLRTSYGYVLGTGPEMAARLQATLDRVGNPSKIQDMHRRIPSTDLQHTGASLSLSEGAMDQKNPEMSDQKATEETKPGGCWGDPSWESWDSWGPWPKPPWPEDPDRLARALARCRELDAQARALR